MSEHDVFISYAHLDNETQWVSQFDENFKKFLNSWMGKKTNIWRDKSMGTGDYIWDTIEDHLEKSRIFLPIVSPSYLNSVWCPRELSAFLENNKKRAGNKSSVLTVRRMPVEKEMIPSELREVLEEVLYREFYTEEESGRVRVHSPDMGDDLRQSFLKNLDDLAQDACQLLKMMQQENTEEGEVHSKSAADQPFRGMTIYLSEPSPDLIDEYLEIKRDFFNRGATILPRSILDSKPAKLADYEAKVAREMVQSDLVVHFVGSEDDLEPSVGNYSAVRAQAKMAVSADQDGGFTRLVLIPKGINPDTETQQKFIAHLNEISSQNFDLLRSSLDLKTEMERILIEKSKAESGTDSKPESDQNSTLKSVYLLFDAEDEAFATNIGKKLFKSGVEVWTVSNSTGAASADLIEEHKYYLSNCDAALVCWSTAKVFRVRAMMSEFVSIMDNGRKKDFAAKGVLVDGSAPEKDSFMTHETVIRNETEFSGFISSLK